MSAIQETNSQPVSTNVPDPVVGGELAPINIIRTETAFSKYPVHNLAKKGRINIEIKEKGDRGEVKIKWEVSYSDRYGQARQLAYKVDTLIVNRRIDEAGRPLPKVIKLGSLREICRALDLNEGQATRDIKKSLHQNASLYITAKITYRPKEGGEKLLEFGSTRYGVVFTGETLPDGTKADAVYVILNDPYREILNSASVRPLDYDYLKALTPSAQRFYEIISRIFYTTIKYNHPHAKLLYSEYCLYSAQQRYYDYDHFKKQMYKVHRPHLKSGYISSVRYEATTDPAGKQDWFMFYIPGLKARAEHKAFNTKRLTPNTARAVERNQPDQKVGRQLFEIVGESVDEKAAPLPNQTNEQSPALEIVQYFYSLARNIENYQPPSASKDLSQAQFLLDTYGPEKTRFIIGFAVEDALKTKFEMRRIGAVFQYVDEALAQLDLVNRKLQQAERLREQEEENRRLEEEHDRQEKEAHAHAEAYLNNLPPDERQALYDRLLAHYRKQYSHIAHWEGETLEKFMKRVMIMEIRKELEQQNAADQPPPPPVTQIA
jgi:hypothetical protein